MIYAQNQNAEDGAALAINPCKESEEEPAAIPADGARQFTQEWRHYQTRRDSLIGVESP